MAEQQLLCLSVDMHFIAAVGYYLINLAAGQGQRVVGASCVLVYSKRSAANTRGCLARERDYLRVGLFRRTQGSTWSRHGSSSPREGHRTRAQQAPTFPLRIAQARAQHACTISQLQDQPFLDCPLKQHRGARSGRI